MGIIFLYSKFFVEPNVYNIKFKDIDGITKGSPVRFMGINIGYVRNLKPQDKYINVQIIVTKKDMKIPNGTVARVEFYGLGGSKSVELMPLEGSTGDGIVTENTIRIADVIKKAESIVEIIELIDRYLKNINSIDMQNSIMHLKEINPESVVNAGKEISQAEKDITERVNNVNEKQNAIQKSIQKVSETVLKINKFIKK